MAGRDETGGWKRKNARQRKERETDGGDINDKHRARPQRQQPGARPKGLVSQTMAGNFDLDEEVKGAEEVRNSQSLIKACPSR